MKQNLSSFERTVRVLLGLILIWLVLYVPMPQILLWLLTIAGIILIPTGIAGCCLIYSYLNISTANK